MGKTIGILTGGGDCPGLNAVIRAVVRHATGTHGWDVLGIEDGFQGLYERRYRKLELSSVRGLGRRGGTVLGSSNRCNPFKYPLRRADGSEEIRDVSDEVLRNLAALGLDALIVVGGDGTMAMSQKLIERGARIVGVPKTIDNDLPATDLTFGHATAVEIATEALDRLHTTAESHDRVILCEVMGRYAGWIALNAGIAGGADAILIPEIPYRVERVVDAVRRRGAQGISFSVVCVAEGARPEGGDHAVRQRAGGVGQDRLGGAAERLQRELEASGLEHEVRTTVLGHVQRGGPPCAFDRVLATRYGARAVDLIAEGGLGYMVALRGTAIETVKIAEATGSLKLVERDGELVQTARATGIELGAPPGPS
jgi:6-phosphofructokinase 1